MRDSAGPPLGLWSPGCASALISQCYQALSGPAFGGRTVMTCCLCHPCILAWQKALQRRELICAKYQLWVDRVLGCKARGKSLEVKDRGGRGTENLSSVSAWSKGLILPAAKGFGETPAGTPLWRMRDAKSLGCVQGGMRFLPLEP